MSPATCPRCGGTWCGSTLDPRGCDRPVESYPYEDADYRSLALAWAALLPARYDADVAAWAQRSSTTQNGPEWAWRLARLLRERGQRGVELRTAWPRSPSGDGGDWQTVTT